MLVTTPVIALHGVAVGYGDRPVVEDVDLVVLPGDVVALVGANGSGKTTLVRGVLGLAPVLAGRVELLGRPAASFRERWRIGYVPQRHTVGGGIPSSVQEFVASGRLARRRLFSPVTAADRQAVGEALETVGLADRRSAPVATLSGGQQRRTLIARALAADPDVLIMDEPTAGVDAAGQESLARTLARLVGQGLTLVVVTHEIEPLLGLLTRVVELREGRVVRDEPLTSAAPAADLDVAREGA
jgi:zinc transport system ATP-binding protein